MLQRLSFLAICGLSAVLAVEATAGDMHPVDLSKHCAITLEDRDKNAPPDARSTSGPAAR